MFENVLKTAVSLYAWHTRKFRFSLFVILIYINISQYDTALCYVCLIFTSTVYFFAKYHCILIFPRRDLNAVYQNGW